MPSHAVNLDTHVCYHGARRISKGHMYAHPANFMSLTECRRFSGGVGFCGSWGGAAGDCSGIYSCGTHRKKNGDKMDFLLEMDKLVLM